jgi:hypothetical protein
MDPYFVQRVPIIKIVKDVENCALCYASYLGGPMFNSRALHCLIIIAPSYRVTCPGARARLFHVKLSDNVTPRSNVHQGCHLNAPEVIFIGFQSHPRLLLSFSPYHSLYMHCTSVSWYLDSYHLFSFFLQCVFLS